MMGLWTRDPYGFKADFCDHSVGSAPNSGIFQISGAGIITSSVLPAHATETLPEAHHQISSVSSSRFINRGSIARDEEIVSTRPTRSCRLELQYPTVMTASCVHRPIILGAEDRPKS